MTFLPTDTHVCWNCEAITEIYNNKFPLECKFCHAQLGDGTRQAWKDLKAARDMQRINNPELYKEGEME